MYNKNLPKLNNSLSIADLVSLSNNAADVLAQVREAMLEPNPRKLAPTFSAAQISNLCGIDKSKFHYLARKHALPLGNKKGNGHGLVFTLDEVYQWVHEIGTRENRPEDKLGSVVAACNYKGGVAKTGTIVSLAQALTLLGRRCLLIDCDPQGSSTQLMGVAPDADVDEDQTLMPLVHGDSDNLDYAIQKTYWSNLDLIPASSALFVAEFVMPSRRNKDKTYEFWDVLRKGIEPLRKQYDVILIDTSPSLSYLTINALIASNGLIMPCPPDALDFASSTQFWKIFSDLASQLPGVAENKRYDFISILLTKVKSDPLVPIVRSWVNLAYAPHVLPMEIPDSTAARSSSAQLKTIYDLSKPDGSVEAYQRYKEPLDRLAQYVDDEISKTWKDN